MDGTGRVLIAQRPDGKHLAGGWEFPGGKLAPREERGAGLARELREELGIITGGPFRPLIRVRHAYPTRDILLDVFVVKTFSGEPQGLDGQALRWCTQEELAEVKLLPADGPIVRALRLPEVLREASSADYTVGELGGARDMDRHGRSRLGGVLCATLGEAAVAAGAGAEFLVLSETLSASELRDLCRLVSVPVYARGFAVEEAWVLGASGTHFS